MNPDLRSLEAAIDRRMLMRMAVVAGLGAALTPRLALAVADPDLMPNLRAMVKRWVGPGKLPGVLVSLGLPGKETQYIARGTEAFTDPDPVTPDSLYRFYSMTKPITGMAAMQLIAEGRMGLDQPLYDVLPKYRTMQVQVVPDGSVTKLRPAKTPITMRHLLTHTAGLGYSIVQQGPIKDLMEEKGLVPALLSRKKIPGLFEGTQAPDLATFADRLAEIPLVYEPGSRWSYSMGLDLMGRVIEVVSGQPFDRYLEETLLGPAGMISTSFQVPEAAAKRLTTDYFAIDGTLIPVDPGADSVFLDKPPFPFGGAGLVGSPRDYDRFLRVLAQGGMIDGKRVLSEAAVRVGMGNLLPVGVDRSGMFGSPSDFGAGGRVGTGDEKGMFGWAGAASTIGMVDAVHGLRMQYFAQFMPYTALDVEDDFRKALKADVMALLEKQ
ncbi:serine hydrolase domain-containing protein [Novosphingobium mangrovi (ex Huang et al. 2023)]|uniref:Beta-lactamase family protein n=1 Tax=Novosphingobium mangrovi (ex Huang et al. 2023) TaxID=2976432 RepID=A0ABT2I0B3_9SPHN|nr:serine hydrolase domain-containing protein [Novosphingobium mangrovi (ex Huang et al. 2023)]MCT2398243.1 beta-lactamase family protein [Novosphingobium mangrovi (ex Huang et al. 2023)]